MSKQDVESAKSHSEREPDGTVTFKFLPPGVPSAADVDVQLDMSAAARVGDSLFLSCDETAGIECLRLQNGAWGDHVHVSIGDMIDLPDGPDGEMDVEGLQVDGDWLWVVGSQSLKRKTPNGEKPGKALKKMENIGDDPNRQFLGRVPLEATARGPMPVRRDNKRRIQHLKFRELGQLRDWLRGDDHLKKFLDIPSKENGLDVEGLAVSGLRVWLGLRGPVLRGHAVILELELKPEGKNRLKAKRIDGKRRYRKHLLPTLGQGVRDLAVDGRDLLLLVGTAMDDPGPSAILRWQGALDCTKSGVRPADELSVAVDLPDRGNVDNPEGLTHWEGTTWMVVHDSPDERRICFDPPQLLADLWDASKLQSEPNST